MEWVKKLTFALGLLVAIVCIPQPAFPVVSNTTVSTTTAHGDGSTVNFTIGFDFRDNSWIVVKEHDTSTSPETVTTISYGAGAGKFTISGGNPGTTVVMGTAPTTTQYLVITRSVPLTQSVVFSASGVFPYQGLSNLVDQMTLELQNLDAANGGSGGGGGGGGTTIPTGVGYNILGWSSDGSTLVNYGTTPATNDVLRFNGTTWANYQLTSANLISTINGGNTAMSPAVGGTGVVNNAAATLTWGNNPITLTTTGTTNVTLPTSGTLVSNPVATGNTVNALVLRDGSGNFSAGTITANISGNVTGNLTGNITGNASGTASNVTGTVAIGHGGTGATTQQAAINALTGTQTDHYILRSDGTNAALGPMQTGDLPSGMPWSKMASQTTNSLLATDGLGAETVIPTNVNSGYVLTSNGTAPYWAPAGSGIPGIYPYGVDSGTANTYVVSSTNPPVIGYSAGIGLSFLIANTNTGASTINVNSLGAKAIKHADGTALVAGDLLAGQVALIEYDGTEFQLINSALNANPTTLNASASVAATVSQRNISANCTLNCTITLPAISSLAYPYPFYVKNVATTTVTVVGSGVDQIDGAANAVLNFQWQAITLTPTSSGWLIQ